jgi:MutS-like protein
MESDPGDDATQGSDPARLRHNQLVPAPADEYRHRLDARKVLHAELSRRDRLHSNGRLATFGVFVLLLALGWAGLTTYWLLVFPVAAFGVLVQRHDRVIHARDAASRAIAFYERGLARIDDRWPGTGEPGERFADDRHPYANDLDLFGRGSLFELLSIARTRSGEETLARWLKAAAAPDEIAQRQQGVAELSPALDLREALSLAGTDVSAGVNSEAVLAWAEEAPILSPPWLRWVAAAITMVVVISIVVWLQFDNERPLLAALAIQVAFAWPQQKRVERALRRADNAAHDLDILGHLLEHLEPQRFSSPRLASLHRALSAEDVVASRAIRTLARLVELHDWQDNLFFLMFSVPLMWGTHVAWAIETWRRAHGTRIRLWLDAAAEFEAFSSLSAYRFEHPDDPFPDIVSSGDGGRAEAIYEGVQLGHPLLPAARSVRNDVRLGREPGLLIVSGSNMSGKSTLLRTVGANAVLALMGAPVRASSLRLSPLAVGATLRIQDSLLEGRSRFYAEITRIRELADLAAGPLPLLFLLDELFHGTNSHDRLVGSSGVLRGLLDRGAIGLITTHDLALTAIARALAPRATNVHFDDTFDGQEIRFDYRLKSGPVTHSNAIALMRAVGLEVPEHE